ncbi:Sec-independent protein translocase subunit TatA/TatB [Arachidicoccus terrestris]|uniref:Sec-independent protein translocase subunit TatA/TatB n=1 Tax=Arachidicoccus terrestris TaxID=2875539 RepID=UPI001CC72BDC|nr:twin-arginine translocase TatA/TatE family subunit [Arachidicoccus terrestris]UAY54319.1 twin-arginine translocase TatA/TatE family subunit [Arachidicoccus terrestris]
MGEIGIKELLLIAIVILLLFGTKKLPELMRGLGKGVKTFNDSKNSVMEEMDNIKKPINAVKNPIGTAKKEVMSSLASKSSITDLDHEPVAEKKS